MEGFMGQSESKDFTKSIDYGIKCTVMGIRESLMQYFKGTNIQSVVQGNINRIGAPNVPSNRRLRNYELHEAELKQRQKLMMEHVTLAIVERNPNTIQLYGKTLKRNDDMKAVFAGLQEFLEKHLRGVHI